MASTLSSLPLLGGSLRARGVGNAQVIVSCKAQDSKTMLSPSRGSNRREMLFSLTAGTVLTAMESAARAESIPLFGIRKKLKKAEEEAEEIVREGIETAEKGIETAEKGIESAEKEIETAVGFGGLGQAGTVLAVEAVGVFVATSVVNGILGPESQKS